MKIRSVDLSTLNVTTPPPRNTYPIERYDIFWYEEPVYADNIAQCDARRMVDHAYAGLARGAGRGQRLLARAEPAGAWNGIQ